MKKITNIAELQKLPLRVAAYWRVSTESQEQEHSLETQKQYYANYIDSISAWTNAGVFAEYASGLTIDHRPEFMKLVRLCQKKKIDLVIAKSVSRFGRNTLDTLCTLRNLSDADVEVYFEVEQLWLGMPTDTACIVYICCIRTGGK